MHEWFIFAFIAATFWSVVVIVDKFVLTHHIKDAVTYQIFLAFVMLPFLVVMLPFIPLNTPPGLIIFTVLLGMILSLVFVLYNRALIIEEASRVTPLLFISPLFVLLFSFLFIGEELSLKRYAGILLMILSAITVSLRGIERGHSLSVSPALLIILFLDVITAGKDVISKLMLYHMDYRSYLFWFILGNIIGRPLLLLIPHSGEKLLTIMRTLPPRIFLLSLINTVLAWTGYILYFKAISMTYVSLVSAIPASQPFLVFIFATILGAFYPELIKEDINRNTIALKGIAVVCIIAGAYMIIS